MDTLQSAERLIESGMAPDQAKAVVRVVAAAAARPDPATKDDLVAGLGQLEDRIGRLETQIIAKQTEMMAKINQLVTITQSWK